MSETKIKNYKGNCHCGAIRFALNVPEIKIVTACNCSICSKKGYLWISPEAGQFEITQGDNVLTSYVFGAKTTDHQVSFSL
jgi:hypothetical protein